jgi:enoyl-CoA hydratase/carnithine racemase
MTGGDPAHNGRGSPAWCGSWLYFKVDRRSRSYCRVTFDHPPINTITATTVAELAELVGLIEEDPDLNVVVFASANPDFYLSDFDVKPDPSGAHAWIDLLARVSRAPVVSIASVRGRARGAGREFVLACDLRLVGHGLDEEVDAIASRLEDFDHAEIARAKLHGDRLVPDA